MHLRVQGTPFIPGPRTSDIYTCCTTVSLLNYFWMIKPIRNRLEGWKAESQGWGGKLHFPFRFPEQLPSKCQERGCQDSTLKDPTEALQGFMADSPPAQFWGWSSAPSLF